MGRIELSDKLELDRFFHAVRYEPYVIVKPNESFPIYWPGSDIDVFCYRVDQFAERLLAVGNSYTDQGFEIAVAEAGPSHLHVDFRRCGRLEFRFDLYGALPEYRRISLKEHYLFSVIENAIALQRRYQQERYRIYVPNPVDDLVLRYAEYVEWYELRPDKIKHLDYILGAVSAEPERIGFLDKLHLYTELRAPRAMDTRRGLARLWWVARSWVRRAPSVPLRRIPSAVLRRLRGALSWIVRRLPAAAGRRRQR